jgi:hypothetical protein
MNQLSEQQQVAALVAAARSGDSEERSGGLSAAVVRSLARATGYDDVTCAWALVKRDVNALFDLPPAEPPRPDESGDPDDLGQEATERQVRQRPRQGEEGCGSTAPADKSVRPLRPVPRTDGTSPALRPRRRRGQLPRVQLCLL